MLVRLCAFVVWALVAASAVFWGLRVSARGPSAPAHTVAVGETSVTRGDLARLLGTGPAPAPVATAAAPPDVSSRFKLLGVMAPKSGNASRGGLALIAVDGKPAKAYAVGAPVDGDLVLQRVSHRSASIGPNAGAAVLLEVPPLSAATTGTLPSPPPFGATAPAPPQPVVPNLPGRTGVRPMPMPVPPPPGASMPGSAVMQKREGGAATQ